MADSGSKFRYEKAHYSGQVKVINVDVEVTHIF